MEIEEQAVIGLNDEGKVVLISGQCVAKNFKKQFQCLKDNLQ